MLRSVVPLSAALYLLSFPKFHQAWLAWIALVPLLVLLFQTISLRRAFTLGWVTGFLSFSGLLYWIVVTFQTAKLSIGLALLCLAALSAYLALFWGLWAWIVVKVQSLPMTPRLFLIAAAWAALEWVRSFLFSGFPWTLLGDSQYRHPALLQITSVTGVYGLSFFIVLVSAGLAQAWTERRKRMQALTFSGLAFALVWGGGYLRLELATAKDYGTPVRVAMLQGNIDQYKKWDKAYVENIKSVYAQLAIEALPRHPELILWPETAVPGYLLQDQAIREWLSGVVRTSRAFHIVGAPVWHDELAYNSAFALDPKAEILGEYTKQHLVPFGEVVPFGNVLGRWVRVLNELGGFAARPSNGLLALDGHAIGVNICYEAIFPALVRNSVAHGAELITNLTNDGWYMRTAAPYQHFAPNVLRAVENGRWLIRADNTGISAIVDPFGHIKQASPIFESAIVTGTAGYCTARTLYTRVGDLFAMLCALATILVIYFKT